MWQAGKQGGKDSYIIIVELYLLLLLYYLFLLLYFYYLLLWFCFHLLSEVSGGVLFLLFANFLRPLQRRAQLRGLPGPRSSLGRPGTLPRPSAPGRKFAWKFNSLTLPSPRRHVPSGAEFTLFFRVRPLPP